MTAVAVVLAVLGAACLAAGTAFQQRISQQVGDPVRVTVLLRRVLGRPRWWIGQAAITLGFVLYATALAYGPLVVVQPMLVTGLIFGTVFSARLAGAASIAPWSAAASCVSSGSRCSSSRPTRRAPPRPGPSCSRSRRWSSPPSSQPPAPCWAVAGRRTTWPVPCSSPSPPEPSTA